MTRLSAYGRRAAAPRVVAALALLVAALAGVRAAAEREHAGAVEEQVAADPRTPAWTVALERGVHWLRTPGGARFYSKGVNAVHGGAETAKSREGLAYYWHRFFPSEARWRAAVETQLRGWGFNTRGAWSDPSRALTLPLTVELDLGRQAKLHWFDPFDPAAEETTRRWAAQLTAPHHGDPRLIGYFTDNEAGWWNSPLFLWYLKAGWENHTKRALWQLIRDHYEGRWDDLLADWVPDAGTRDFEDLRRAGATLKLRPGGRGIGLIGRFTYLCARRYYELVRRALRAAHPEALILGDRLPLYYDQDAVRAMADQVDVVSTNYNLDVEDGWVAPYYFEGLARLTGKPVLVSEFFFAADENRSGNLNLGHLMTVATQAERARGAARALAGFARFPNVVGAHWFQYADEPFGGRGDGEDYNMGLVDTSNRPYRALADALRRVNQRLETLHRASRFVPAPSDGAVALPRAQRRIDLADHSLADWDKARTRLTGFLAPAPYVPFADVHAAWAPEGLYLATLASNYVDLALLDHQGEFPLSESLQLRLAVEREGERHEFIIALSPQPSGRFVDRLEITPRLYRAVGGAPVERLPETGRVSKLDRPIPHVALEAFFPAAWLGAERLVAGMRLAVRIEMVSFYRERTMTWSHAMRLADTAR